ncbi:Bcas2 family protein [Scedosporium apiospermum]|uniref:Bcas2 family protein n=1 Tax=Pseudallescheria apiosperma TaxID=563466 RepID=A0A084FU79_PSEDA|nr:Bcas2 family protein [Scedosporium apiospermum]KEZ38641.1 Bcas2 family protein [Scedosporium apiospermum]
MSIREEIFESLPYIDPEPTESQLAAAQSLITAELPPTQPPHPSLRPSPEPTFSPAISSLLFQQTTPPTPLTAIDLTRYEEQDPLPPNAPLDAALTSLSRAYASAAYLSGRTTSLDLLSSHGKNAWLVANWQLESYLTILEAELAAARASVDRLALERRRAQDHVAAEMAGLEDAWKKGVAKTLETEVAVEEVKREIRERMRARGDVMNTE